MSKQFKTQEIVVSLVSIVQTTQNTKIRVIASQEMLSRILKCAGLVIVPFHCSFVTEERVSFLLDNCNFMSLTVDKDGETKFTISVSHENAQEFVANAYELIDQTLIMQCWEYEDEAEGE